MTMIEKIAEEIADKVFKNAMGEEAQRIMLISAKNKDLGGYGKGPFKQIVKEVFELVIFNELLRNAVEKSK